MDNPSATSLFTRGGLWGVGRVASLDAPYGVLVMGIDAPIDAPAGGGKSPAHAAA